MICDLFSWNGYVFVAPKMFNVYDFTLDSGLVLHFLLCLNEQKHRYLYEIIGRIHFLCFFSLKQIHKNVYVFNLFYGFLENTLICWNEMQNVSSVITFVKISLIFFWFTILTLWFCSSMRIRTSNPFTKSHK